MRERIPTYIAFWRERLGLTNWQLHVRYAGRDGEEGTAAGSSADPEYEQAELYFDVKTLGEQRYHTATPALLSYLVLHELVHVPLYALSVLGKEYAPAEVTRTTVERATCALTAALWRCEYGTNPPEVPPE